jgi:hypothetical protein
MPHDVLLQVTTQATLNNLESKVTDFIAELVVQFHPAPPLEHMVASIAF